MPDALAFSPDGAALFTADEGDSDATGRSESPAPRRRSEAAASTALHAAVRDLNGAGARTGLASAALEPRMTSSPFRRRTARRIARLGLVSVGLASGGLACSAACSGSGQRTAAISAAAQPTGWSDRRGPLLQGGFAYDAARQRIVTLVHRARQETWEYDGVRWARALPASTRPSGPAANGCMAYDAARRRTVLFAARSTWEWDGATWQDRTPAGPQPPDPQSSQAIVCHAALQRVVLFAGAAAEAAGTWEWDGTMWTRRDAFR
jgi:hypothetical protein